MPEKLLAFDPSSSCTGWALGLRDDRDLQVCQADLLRPPGKVTGWLKVRWMAVQARKVIAQCKPDQIIIEVPDGKIQGGIKKAAGLSIYGAAVGAIDNECGRAAFTVAVTPRQWVGNFKKSQRPVRAAMLWSGYAAIAGKDRGKDIADAVCLLDHFAMMLAREDRMRLVK